MIRYGAVEAGGTKMVLTVCGEDLKPLEKAVLPTEEPGRTLPAMIDFFRDKGISALGIGSFGPLQLNPAVPDYGSITTTPKLAWRSVPILKAMTDALNVPGEIDTDVNAAALAEETALTVEDVELTERGDGAMALRVLLTADGESAALEMTVRGAKSEAKRS